MGEIGIPPADENTHARNEGCKQKHEIEHRIDQQGSPMKPFFSIAIIGLCLLFFASACAGPKVLAEGEVQATSLSLEIRGKTWWTWRIDADGIKGNGVNLKRDGNVFFGFMASKPVRLRRMRDGDREWLSTPAGNLTVKREVDGIFVAGMLNEQRIGAGWDGGLLLLSNPKINLGLKRGVDKQTLVDPEGEIRLVFQGTDPDPILRRPEILWLLLRRVLTEAKSALAKPPMP